MKRKTVIILISVIMLMFLFSGCNDSKVSEDPNKILKGKINVYTTLYVLEEFSNKIGGDYVDVINLVPPGVSPHDFEPSARDITSLVKGDVFIYNGAGLELWVNNVLENLKDTEVLVVNGSENIELIKVIDNHQTTYDPHVWLNPLNAIKQAEVIKDTFIELDPEHRSIYEINYLQLMEELIALDNKFENELNNIERKDFYVSHAAFGYLAQRYNLIQHSISGFTSEDEPSSLELHKIIENIEDLGIKYILVDSTEVTKISEVIAKEVGIETVEIFTIGSLNKQELASGLDYVKIMELNLEVLKMTLRE